MPLPQIAVEIVVPDAPRSGTLQKKNPVESSELRRALLQACSDTVQVAVCVPADTARQAAALALVFWKAGGRVRIEVGTKESPGGQTWTSREIDFSPKDAPLERWRAAGFAAGTLASLVVRGDRGRAGSTPATGVDETSPRDTEAPTAPTAASAGAQSKGEAPPSERPAAPPDTPPARSPEPPPERDDEDVEPARTKTARGARMWLWSFDATGVFGSGITVTNPRIGGLVRVSRAFGGPFVTMSLGYAVERPMFIGLSVDWLLPSFGAGYVARLGPLFTVEARVELLAELLHGHAEDTAAGAESTAYRWLGGARAGLGVAWAPSGVVSLLVGGAASARGPQTDILMRNLVQTTTSIAGYQLEAGIRFTLR